MFETTRNKIPAIGCVCLAGIFIFTGCIGDQQHDLEATGTMPGATGKVTISKDNLSNTIVEIEAQNLVALDKNQEDAHYVAWTQFKDESVKLGTLKIVGGNGKLIAKTKLNRFKVLVTSEELPSVTKPASTAILRTVSIII